MITKRELMQRIVNIESVNAGFEEDLLILEKRLEKLEKPVKKTTKKVNK